MSRISGAIQSAPAIGESLYEIQLYREFAEPDALVCRLPDESTILRFCHRLKKHELNAELLATSNATLIVAPSAIKNNKGERDPEMHQSKKGNLWSFGMKSHVRVDADLGLLHTNIGTVANVIGAIQGQSHLLTQHRRCKCLIIFTVKHQTIDYYYAQLKSTRSRAP